MFFIGGKYYRLTIAAVVTMVVVAAVVLKAVGVAAIGQVSYNLGVNVCI